MRSEDTEQQARRSWPDQRPDEWHGGWAGGDPVDEEGERRLRELREGLIRGRGTAGTRWEVSLRAAVAMAVVCLVLGAAAAGLLVRSGPADDAVLVGGTGSVPAVSGAAEEDLEVTPGPDIDRSGTPATASSSADQLRVYVTGQVRHPGVVPVEPGARVLEAVEAAGGATRRADLSRLNLARKVVDGEQILVPRPGQAVPGEPVAGAPAAGLDGATVAVLDLNTASAEQLEQLPGVGPVLAARIIEWRTENGSFGAVDDLNEVSGIGDATMDELRPLVRV